MKPQPRRRPAAGTVAGLVLAAVTLLAAAGVIAGLVWGYVSTASLVTVDVDDMTTTLRGHEATVADLLDEIGLVLAPEDWLEPPLDTPLQSGLTIKIQRARPLLIHGDSRLRTLRTHQSNLDAALAEAGITLGPVDEVYVDGQPATPASPLPAVRLAGERRLPGLPNTYPWQGAALAPVQVTLKRALPLTLHEGGPESTLWTTASTVGEALAAQGLVFYVGDRVQPGLGTPVTAGMHVYVDRSIPVAIQTRDRTLYTRTRRTTVADLLAEQGLLLTGQDRIEPALDTPLSDDLAIHITRVQTLFDVEEEIAPFSSIWQPDPEAEIDTRGLEQEGAKGITRRRYRITLEDGQPITRTLEDTWLAQEPITKVLTYGTKVVLRDITTEEGPATYWRKIRMFATSYTAADSGVPRDAPYYGRTRLGWQVGFGVAAVDPQVIRLGSTVFVPGYGIAHAVDTGGAIKGRWIDLAYDDGRLVPWSRCVDVYVLEPVPPSYQIEYLLPNWPQVRCLG